MVLAVAMKEKGVVTTSFPRQSNAIKARISASVPDETETALLTPVYLAKASSNLKTLSPMTRRSFFNAEAAASITKVFSGVLSDRLGRRKPLAVAGYGLAALSKPLFPLATSAAWVFTARFVDRIGKGIRGAPRDALVADCSPPEVRGAAYGLRQSLDTAGALIGPLAAIALMTILANDVRAVFWIAVLPGIASVALLALGVEEPARHVGGNSPRRLPHWRDVRSLGGGFWVVTAIGSVFTLARFSEAFLVLRANQAGLSLAWAPLALVVMNLAYVASAYPAGRLSDRAGRIRLLAAGLAVLIVSDVVLATGQQIAILMLGIALWGLHLGLTQGLLAAMVADSISTPMAVDFCSSR